MNRAFEQTATVLLRSPPKLSKDRAQTPYPLAASFLRLRRNTMMTSNAMSTARSCVVWRITTTRCYKVISIAIVSVYGNISQLTPTWQTMPRAKRQFQVRIFLTLLHVVTRWRSPVIPYDTLTCLITGLYPKRASSEAVTEERVHIVPNRAIVYVERKYELAGIGSEETARRGSNLEGYGVGAEELAVRAIL